MKRSPIGVLELTVSVLAAVDCLAINAAAVAYLPRLSREELGPLALAFHDKQPPPALFAILCLLTLMSSYLPRIGRAALLVFVGAAAANLLSPALWNHGAPDYIVLRELDVIANLSDVLMVGSGAIVVAAMLVELARRRR